MITNLTNISNIENLGDVASYANASTNGAFFSIIVIAIFVILVIRWSNNGMEKSIAGAGYICIVLSSLLTYSGLISIIIPIIFLFLTAGATWFAYHQ